MQTHHLGDEICLQLESFFSNDSSPSKGGYTLTTVICAVRVMLVNVKDSSTLDFERMM